MRNNDFNQLRLPILTLTAMLAVGFSFGGWTLKSLAQADYEAAAVPAAPAADDGAASREEIQKINDEVKAKRQLIEDLNSQIEVQKKKISQQRSETATLESQVGILENRIAKTELDIKETQAEIDASQLEIRALELALNDQELKIAKQKTFIAEYLRTMYRYEDRSYLEVLLLHDSFSEFFDYIKYLEDVEGNIADRLTELRILRASLLEQKSAKELKKSALDELNAKLVEIRARLEEERGAKEVLVEESFQSESQLRSQLSRLRAEQSAADSEIVSMENSLRRKLATSDKFAGLGDSVVLSWPVDPSRGITTYFHDPDYPFRYVFEHPGLDIRAAQGTPVRSAAPGFVARAKDAGMGYSYVMIIHADGISTVYGHVSRILVKEDQYVERGEIIALSGATPGTPGAGRLTTGPHLHYEVRSNGIPVNPLDYLLK